MYYERILELRELAKSQYWDLVPWGWRYSWYITYGTYKLAQYWVMAEQEPFSCLWGNFGTFQKSQLLSYFLSNSSHFWSKGVIMHGLWVSNLKIKNFENLLYCLIWHIDFHIFQNLTTKPSRNGIFFGTTRILSFLATL